MLIEHLFSYFRLAITKLPNDMSEKWRIFHHVHLRDFGVIFLCQYTENGTPKGSIVSNWLQNSINCNSSIL